MKKIILFEDKIDRDSKQQCNINLNECTFLETVFGSNECTSLLSSFIDNDRVLSLYDTILIHASIEFSDDISIIDKLKNYCNANSKKLVIFSGGGDIGSLQNNTLNITAKSLYENIEIFLKEYQKNTSNLLMLAHGQNWILNILLNSLEKLNLYIENNKESEKYNIFLMTVGLNKIKQIIDTREYDSIIENIETPDRKININQMKQISANLKKLIQDKANV